ncbi:hypothetical protein [uncultured Nostoc sp.]|uniref:hypothetical protein n=1 Tax=uncultured Nostoc sp. TaxID=340711 RepID=UPI002631F54B|nr:hypothetical protein [uncultured Nostoc sp.]
MINKHSYEQSHNLLNKLQQDINDLILKVDNQLQLAELDLRNEQIQDELAKQIVLLQRFGEYISVIQTSKRQSLAECIALQSKVYAVNLALSFLIMKKTEKITLAKNIRYSIEYFLNTKKPLGWIGNLFKRSIRELPTPTKVLFGLAMAIPVYMIAIPVSFGIVNYLANKVDATSGVSSPSPTLTANPSKNLPESNENRKQQLSIKIHFNKDHPLVVMVALSGAFGSIVSILIRLQDYKYRDEYVGSVTPIVVGFVKPLIGTAFGIFVFALLSSGIINFPSIQSNTSKQSNTSNQTLQDNPAPIYYFYFSIAFLVGFSERLDNDIVERVGGSLGLQKSAVKIGEDVQQNAVKIGEVQQSLENIREYIEQANNLVRSNASDLKKVTEDAEKILPEVQEVVEDIKKSTLE